MINNSKTMENIIAKKQEKYRAIGSLAVLKGDYKRGIVFLKKAYRSNQNNVETLIDLGVAYQLMDKDKISLKYFKKATLLEPRNKKAWDYLGISLTKLANFSEAEEALSKALEIAPNNKDTLGYYYHNLTHQKKYKEAEKYIRKVIDIDKDDKEYWTDLGLNLTLQKKYKEAEDIFNNILESDPGNEYVSRGIKSVYSEQNKELKNFIGYLNVKIEEEELPGYYERIYSEIVDRLLKIDMNNFSKQWIDFAVYSSFEGHTFLLNLIREYENDENKKDIIGDLTLFDKKTVKSIDSFLKICVIHLLVFYEKNRLKGLMVNNITNLEFNANIKGFLKFNKYDNSIIRVSRKLLQDNDFPAYGINLYKELLFLGFDFPKDKASIFSVVVLKEILAKVAEFFKNKWSELP